MTFRQVDAFRTLMTSRTMTGAAERMSITQPAVSRLIADLEAALDMRLFERSGPRLRPTPAALRLIKEVERVFCGLDYIEESARRIRRFPMDPFRIAAPPFLSHAFIARLVAALTGRLGDLTISLHTDTSHAIAEQVARSQHDVGFCTLTALPQDLTVLHRMTVAMVCLLPRTHRLADKPQIHVSDLEDERLYVLGKSGSNRPQIDKAFADARITPAIVGEVLHAASSAGFVSEALGVALLDPFSAQMASRTSTVIRSFRPEIPMEIATVAPLRIDAPRIVAALKDLLDPTFQDQLAP